MKNIMKVLVALALVIGTSSLMPTTSKSPVI